MICYDNLWKTMKRKNISTYTLREKYNFHTDTIRKLRNNGNVMTETLNKLCKILDCNLSDIAEFIPD